MGFWNNFAKATATTAGAGATIAAAGVGIGAIVAASRKRKIEDREMALKEQNAAVDRECKIKELELREKKAMLDAETAIQTTNIKYGEGKIKPSVIVDRDGEDCIISQNQQVSGMNNSAMAGNSSNASDVQKKILDAYQMFQSGILSEQEFTAMKAQILAGK